MCKTLGIALVAALYFTTGGTASAVEEAGQTDAATLAQRITAARRVVSSALIEYRRVKTVMDGRTAAQPVVVRHVVFAFDGEKRYQLSHHLPGSVVRQRFAQVEQTDVPTNTGTNLVKTQLVYDGQELYQLTNDQMVSIYSADTVQQKRKGTVFAPYYLKLIGWQIPDTVAPSDANERAWSVFLPAVLTAPTSHYTVRTDLLDGHPCLVVEGSFSTPFGDRVHDKMWLSPEHGFLPLQREYRDSQGHLIASVIAEEPTRFAGDHWLLKVITNNNYTTTEKDTQALKSQEIVELVNATIGELDPALFAIQLPQPALVTDYRTKRKTHSTYVRHTDGETSNMDGPIEYVADKLVQRVEMASRPTGRWAYLWVALAVGFSITVLLVYRRRIAYKRS